MHILSCHLSFASGNMFANICTCLSGSTICYFLSLKNLLVFDIAPPTGWPSANAPPWTKRSEKMPGGAQWSHNRLVTPLPLISPEPHHQQFLRNDLVWTAQEAILWRQLLVQMAIVNIFNRSFILLHPVQTVLEFFNNIRPLEEN